MMFYQPVLGGYSNFAPLNLNQFQDFQPIELVDTVSPVIRVFIGFSWCLCVFISPRLITGSLPPYVPMHMTQMGLGV